MIRGEKGDWIENLIHTGGHYFFIPLVVEELLELKYKF